MGNGAKEFIQTIINRMDLSKARFIDKYRVK